MGHSRNIRELKKIVSAERMMSLEPALMVIFSSIKGELQEWIP
jgi:hypothetical protein